ncbi:hypothetical protein D3C83_09080 [compost metagenome]
MSAINPISFWLNRFSKTSDRYGTLSYTARVIFTLTTGSMVPNGSITWNACSGRFDGSKQKQ